MFTGRRSLRGVVMAGLALAVAVSSLRIAAAGTLPSRLSDLEFWSLITELSEPGGSFRSDNLLSNELRLQYVLPEIDRTVPHGRAYVGVGPEQNFTYIAAVEPSMAFIVDIRRGNLLLHLMYKAIFEMSENRVEFVARLFSRKTPDGVAADAGVKQIFDAVAAADASDALYEHNLKAIEAHLSGKHGFPLSEDDRTGLAHVLHAFYRFGPAINYASSEEDGAASVAGSSRPSYAELMTATDNEGRARSYLGSEGAFAFVKTLESKNLIVPVVGDFAGPRALRAVGAYLTMRSALVSAFYVSNVEQYLRASRVWGAFCGNAARLPFDETSTFIRAGRGGRYVRGGGALTLELTPMTIDLDGCDRRP